MIIRHSAERGFFDHGWLKTMHSFSFAGYYNPQWMGFRSLRVINDDLIAPRSGFPMHPHRDMEIISYVVSGSISHRDSMGVDSVLGPGEIQVMSAGSGIRHSEHNPSATEQLRLLQIWIEPDQQNIEPRYDQRHFDQSLTGHWQLLAGPADPASEPLVPINADVRLSRALLDPGQSLEFENAEGRACWLQVVNGSGTVDDVSIARGDGVVLETADQHSISSGQRLEVLLFDLA